MSYFSKLADLGFMVVCRRNRLNSTTMFALRPSDVEGDTGDGLYLVPFKTPCDDLDDLLTCLPEWRLVDFVGDDAARGAELLYKKLTLGGEYAKWDEKVGHDPELVIGFEHRPESERFRPVDDTPAPPPELVEDLNLQGP